MDGWPAVNLIEAPTIMKTLIWQTLTKKGSLTVYSSLGPYVLVWRLVGIYWDPATRTTWAQPCLRTLEMVDSGG